MARNTILDSEEELSQDPTEQSSEENDGSQEDNAANGNADVEMNDESDEDEESAEPAAADAKPAVAAAAAAAPAKRRQQRKPAAAAAAAAAEAGAGGLGNDILTVMRGVLSQGLNPAMVGSMEARALQQPEVQAALARVNAAAAAAGVPAVSSGKVRPPRTPHGPSNYNVVISAALAAFKAADRDAPPMGVMAKAWASVPKEQQQPIMDKITHIR
jgi:hypothetical protein